MLITLSHHHNPSARNMLGSTGSASLKKTIYSYNIGLNEPHKKVIYRCEENNHFPPDTRPGRTVQYLIFNPGNISLMIISRDVQYAWLKRWRYVFTVSWSSLSITIMSCCIETPDWLHADLFILPITHK